jgi:hypothetical protein
MDKLSIDQLKQNTEEAGRLYREAWFRHDRERSSSSFETLSSALTAYNQAAAAEWKASHESDPDPE